MAKLLPASKFVVIEPTKYEGNGIIDVVTKEQPTLGRVLEIGKGVRPVSMKIGDIIAYRQYGQSKFILNLKDVYFVGFADILGVVKEN